MTSSTDPGPGGSTATIVTQTRVLQIIVGALVMGVLMFAGYVILTQLNKLPQGKFLSYFAVAFGAVMAILHVVVPATVERAALANQSVGAKREDLVGVFFIRTIIAAALLEGAALLSLVAVMTEHHPWVLGVTAVMLVLMLMQIPSLTRIEHWLESRLMELDSGR